MARTPEGAALTTARRVAVNALAEGVATVAARRYTALIDPADVDAGRGAWVAETTAQAVAAGRRAVDDTMEYLEAYSAAEGGSLQVVRPVLSVPDVATSLEVHGPIAFKAAKKRGADDSLALALSRTRASMAARGVVMDAARRTVTATARASRARWRRVTDGKPCAFCAMLAARGPVYAEDTADFEAHGKCGCTAEACFEPPDEWVRQYATPVELDWINAYFDAAEAASDARQPRVAPVRKAGKHRDTVLARMRRLHPDLFHDGVHPRH